MTLKVFGTKPVNSIFLPQMPFAVRNDCQIGQWKIGDEDFRGNSLDISIIKVSQFFGSLGKTKNAQWLQVWFIPAPSEEKLPSSTVCITYIKSRSISQFSQKITELMASGEPALGIFTASFEKHAGDMGTYYSLRWDWRNRGNDAENTQIEQIATFMQTAPNLFDMNNAANLICIDGMSNEEISTLINLARAEAEEPQAQPKNGKLARK